MDRVEALEAVLAEVDRDPGGIFALHVMANVLRRVPQAPNIPFPLFVPVGRLMVPAAVELVIVRKGQVLLTRREKGDTYFMGLHTPGNYILPGETLEEAVRRCALREVGSVTIVSMKVLDAMSNTDSPRFNDCSVLVLCEIEGEPEHGEWCSAMPPDLIPVHRKFWQVVEKALRGEV